VATECAQHDNCHAEGAVGAYTEFREMFRMIVKDLNLIRGLFQRSHNIEILMFQTPNFVYDCLGYWDIGICLEFRYYRVSQIIITGYDQYLQGN